MATMTNNRMAHYNGEWRGTGKEPRIPRWQRRLEAERGQLYSLTAHLEEIEAKLAWERREAEIERRQEAIEDRIAIALGEGNREEARRLIRAHQYVREHVYDEEDGIEPYGCGDPECCW